jgi:hypothetical protein
MDLFTELAEALELARPQARTAGFPPRPKAPSEPTRASLQEPREIVEPVNPHGLVP